MFERYTEKARRVIFFARYEASQHGQPYIESEYLLLGLLREDKVLTTRFLRSHRSVESIREKIEERSRTQERISGTPDLPLSNESKRILAYAAEDAEGMGNKHIGVEHLFLGMLHEDQSFTAELLRQQGLTLSKVRDELIRRPHNLAGQNSDESLIKEHSRDLTEAAAAENLDPVAGRTRELDGIIEVLCSLHIRNPLLIGEFGVGRSTIIEGLAQRIASGKVPEQLARKRILLLDPERILQWKNERERVGQRLTAIFEAARRLNDLIFVVDDVEAFFAAASRLALDVPGDQIKRAILKGEIQFVAATTPSGYRELVGAAPWLENCLRKISISPFNEAGVLDVLRSRRGKYEKFHGVVYTEAALECAARRTIHDFPGALLPGKALEIIDAAGSRVKLGQPAVPAEVS
ncbi:MAG: Clp protease N-terminal domain-containing protein [Terracidiphilus sp.]|jgi:ATP-dependent Clp protease ATP-binding subunit ClpC